MENIEQRNEEKANEQLKTSSRSGFNVIYIISAFLFLAIVGIYILYFTSKSPSSASFDKISEKSDGQIAIAYVNSDSIMENYAMVKELEANLEKKQKKVESEFNWTQESFKKEAMEFYEKLQTGQFLSQQQAEQEQQKLAQKEQQIYEMGQKLSQDLAEMEIQMNETLLDSITNYLKRYTKEKPYDFILGFSKGGGILYAKDDLDITEDVLKGLNEEYNAINSESKPDEINKNEKTNPEKDE